MSIASQLSFSTATSVLAGTAGALLYQSAANTTAFLTIGTNGYVLTSNGSVPGWSLASGITSGASTQVQTAIATTSANYFPTFVDSNNLTATAETVYTTSSFYINPFNGALNLSGTGGFSLAQPTPITFANGQQIKDNGGGGLTIVSSNAINLSSVVGNGGITMSPTTTNYAQQSSALLSVNGSIHATEYLISAASSQQASGAKIQRVYTTNAVAGSIYPLGIWNDTEGAVALEIQVSSETSANSGSTTYRWQGGYASVASTGTYYRLFPFNEGRGHGDGADTGLNLNAWGAYVYKTDDYTYGIAVSVPAGRTAKTLVTTISELKRGMTYVAGFNTATTVWTTGTSVYSHKNLIVETLVTATTGYFNGTVTANSFVGAFTGAVTGAASQVQTVLQTANASYFPAFVNANNASATAMSVYTTSSFIINPLSGASVHGPGIGFADSYGTANNTYKVIAYNVPTTSTNVDDVIRVVSKYNAAVGASAFPLQGVSIVFAGGIGDNQTRDRARLVAVYEGSNMSGMAIHTQSTADLVIERMRVSSSNSTVPGAVLIATTATTNANGILQINGNLGMAPSTQIRQWTNADGGTLQLFATQVVTGSSNAISYSYTEGAYLASVSNSDSAILLDTGRANTLVSGWARFRVVNQAGQHSSIQLIRGTTSTFYADTTNLYVGAGYTSKQVGETLGVLGGVYVSGTVTATTFAGAFTGAVTGASTQVQTTLQTANASYYPTFVSANNASATAMSVYTTSSFAINASTGLLTSNAHTVNGALNVTSVANVGTGANGDVFSAGGSGANVVINGGSNSGGSIRHQYATGSMGVYGGGQVTTGLVVASTGIVTINATTNATTTLTGALIVTGGVGIGRDVWVGGGLYATTKSFVIDHPTKPGMKLRYGSLEGPENGVYVRGKLTDSNKIELPEYWTKLVDPDSITVSLTSIGKHQDLYVADIADNVVTVGNGNILSKAINCFYVVYGERVDVDKLVVEI